VTEKRVNPAEFDKAWQYLEPAVLSGRGHNRQTIWDALAAKRARLFLLEESAIISTIWTYPNGWRSAHAWLAGGAAAEICQWAATTGIDYATRNKCDDARMTGRKGFRRMMPESSLYKEMGTILVRDL
jgi:hypothetical protein